jgi:hypothetical protein
MTFHRVACRSRLTMIMEVSATHQICNFQPSLSLSCPIDQKNPYVKQLSLKAALLQLNFPAFLRESARAAAPQTKAIAKRGPPNAIALTDFLASAELSPVGGMC